MSQVGYASTSIPQDEQSLRQLLDRYSQPGDFFFLRWLHKVSGFTSQLDSQISPEGQLFNATFELRWKKRRQGYDVLWLGLQPPQNADNSIFTAIDRPWQTDDRLALLHNRKTPQYPNLFIYPSELKDQIRQRYFRDGKTGIVHFVALTVHQPVSSHSTQA